MPELPEVENVKMQLLPLVGEDLNSYEIGPKSLRYKDVEDLPFFLGNTLLNIKRKGRYLILEFSIGNITLHLGMTGQLRIEKLNFIKQTHDHLILSFGRYFLVYNDARRFGGIETALIDIPRNVLNLGIEPLSPNFTKQTVRQYKQYKKPIKVLLMDNHIITGIGNIYACEILFLSKISPFKLGNKVSEKQIESLYYHIPYVLNKALFNGGSTIKNYRQVNGESGKAQFLHNVYNKTNQKCPVCTTPIEQKPQAGRTTFFCKKCQR